MNIVFKLLKFGLKSSQVKPLQIKRLETYLQLKVCENLFLKEL